MPNFITFRIVDYCAAHAKENKHPAFNVYDNLVPIVNTVNCFDKLRVGPEHVSRQVTDTYYLNEDTVRLFVPVLGCYY